ncbi:uncharacterized protein LOC124439895 [Xenia sp. Carnegie-2017]|uniref:uncharacterized protein LOC124439895 n=1 Tax=Xenia sp. Carnegie-2017 TaxID=2897299 RepID=UPI001F03D9B6|nr:uncharacterized protein LOC124439895 [Xenia sp. Carnegie-2017]
MKVIILAAGYGTRLQNDIENDPSKEYKHLMHVPKPLVPVGGKSLISRWMKEISILMGKNNDDKCLIKITKVYVVTNHFYIKLFSVWAKEWPEVEVLDDGTQTNETRLGAVADINLCINKFEIKDDVLIIGGDTLFYHDFDLRIFLEEFSKKNEEGFDGALVTCYKCKDSDTKRAGILELDANNRVVAFLEKPHSSETLSRWACPCFYVLSRHTVQFVPEFLKVKNTAPMKEKDAPGHFIKYLQKKVSIYAAPLKSGRFDIGNLESYIECNRYFTSTEYGLHT